ncbi:MAG: penicillin-binding transpeptidase domain-containing protein [Oscillospiraceae bacterium]
MNKLIKPGRLAAFVLLIVGLLGLYITELYKLQIIQGEENYERSKNSVVTTQTVTAARGNIMDRYGRVLVSNRECYNIRLNENSLFKEGKDPNKIILDMIEIVKSCGDTYTDELPITMAPPFEYTDMSNIQRVSLKAYLDDKAEEGLKADTTSVELMSYFRGRYKIDNNYSAEDMRAIAGVRYEINVRYAPGLNTSPYVFVQDASVELISKLMEKYGDDVTVETSFLREYKTQYAAHLLGYIAQMNADEMEKYSKNEEYSLDAKVGRDGAELAFEKYLHGKDGEAKVTRTASGTVTGTVYTKEPEPGEHVYLTIDIQLQEAAERALATGTANIQAKRETENAEAIALGAPDKVKEDVQGSAVVVVDVKTGEPLAIASYPTFDLATFQKDYTKLSEDKAAPLFNRALMGAYAPGSTFKPCTAIACLSENVISTEYRVKCLGKYMKYADQGYAPECWIYAQHMLHGNDNVTEAIRDSCNYFFYTVGNEVGIDRMNAYAHKFGLGEHTGIELTETTGNMSNRDNHMELAGKEWTYGDTLQAAIGQADSLFSPLQLAEYCATVANGGTRHSASILKAVRSYDFGEKIYQNNDEVLSTVESADYNWTAVQEGMYLVANDSAGSAYIDFFGYPIGVAAKTGTAQLGEGKTNNAIFMCYAPYDNPEIAIAVVMERGGSGSALCPIAREIMDTYLTIRRSTDVMETENTLLK